MDAPNFSSRFLLDIIGSILEVREGSGTQRFRKSK
jgi:hypothetical protein